MESSLWLFKKFILLFSIFQVCLNNMVKLGFKTLKGRCRIWNNHSGFTKQHKTLASLSPWVRGLVLCQPRPPPAHRAQSNILKIRYLFMNVDPDGTTFIFFHKIIKNFGRLVKKNIFFYLYSLLIYSRIFLIYSFAATSNLDKFVNIFVVLFFV